TLLLSLICSHLLQLTEQHERCWHFPVHGHCRKTCRVTEKGQVLCTNGRSCCLREIPEISEILPWVESADTNCLPLQGSFPL
uniref:Beta-defensin n=1 Tax=Peromyscus maniculatus bairdii TaxID=230844 RepID=A0A8C8W726_PERMB